MMLLRMSAWVSMALLIVTSSFRPFVVAFSSSTALTSTAALYRSRNRLAMTLSSSASSPSSSFEKKDTVASAARALKLFIETPLILSSPLTALTGPDRPVYLKLDALQQSGSFKDRGMAHLCHTLQLEGVQKLVSSSGGNAGLAVAVAGKQLGMQVAVVVPVTTKQMVIAKLQGLGADVTVHGDNWNAADVLARQRVQDDPGTAAYISPYDNPLLWTGHSSVIDEIDEQLQLADVAAVLSTVVVSVGGGGLICGVLEGLARRGLTGCAVIAAETVGASSFGQAFKKGELVRLSGIDSVATSLGALEVTPAALDRAAKHQQAGGVVREAICTDAEAVHACWQFAQDHRLLVEPACGAALAVVYSERLREELLKDVGNGPIVIEVCGGSGVSLELLMQWKKDYLE